MPRLMLFGACEKVIVGQEDNSGSLISILQGFNVPAEAPTGDDSTPTLLPLTWYVFALWEAKDHVPGQHVQRMALFAPDSQTPLFTADVPIVGENDRARRFHRAALKRHGFLYRGAGDYIIRLYLKDGDGEFIELPDVAFPIPVTVR